MRQTPINSVKILYKPMRRYSKTVAGEVTEIKGRFMSERVTTTKSPSWTPRFGAVKESGSRLRPLSYSHAKRIESFQQGWRKTWSRYGSEIFVSEERTGGCPWIGASPVLKGTDSSATSSARTKAIANFLERIKDSKFNGAQAFAEAAQVQKMIGNFAVTTAKVLTSLRRGDLVSAGTAVGLTIGARAATRYRRLHKGLKSRDDIDAMLANGVLTVQYGIRPLISDVIGAAELYAQKRCHEVVNNCKSGATYEFSDTWSKYDESAKRTQSARYSVRATVNYGCTFAKGSETLHTMAQLGLTNPLLLSWELMPWSFVIDWVLPVGDYLASIDATLGLSFVDGYESVKVTSFEEWHQTQASDFSLVGNSTRTSEVSSTSTKVESFSRTVLTAFPAPQLPNFKNPASWEHAMNGVALLQKFKKTVYF